MRLGTALVDMFARCGDPQSAIKVFDNMARRDVSAWTAAIGALAMQGNGERALELFDNMHKQGVKPDVVFVAVLTAYSHVGLLEQGRNIFICMVDLLGRAGGLEEAVDLVKSMPMEPNDVIWGTLLAACQTHKKRTGIHVLLSNIYASAGKWADVAKVRLQLKEEGIQKVPGCSSVEVNGVIHEFTSGGDADTHTERSHIALMQEINSRLRDACHVPDLDNVMLNVDEKERVLAQSI
ncbi:putative pentatricopeptide [Rosa chinensis]|uniref:Putative pentatricopeptide n=1 Tax=Rosa chinensis TaxID=74649 RepID=A0A2P6QPA2_ROSCH|nr:putative pentatricopeptide [Rosa chinensis]